MTNYSKNDKAEKLLGKRGPGTPIDQPAELGFHCPVYHYELTPDGNFDERLHWSEYNGMLWCSVCNVDWPSCLCQPDPYQATEIFLKTVEDAVERAAVLERKRCWEEINKWIKTGPLPGNGCDESAQRNGLVLAANLIMERINSAIGGDQGKAGVEKG